ncbi:shufflon system plasmid conjugative transfer pilus tip adhesin PilV [Vreelandella rituensis]|nr:shufflon system plasmid conjugative transfer pilus tip adhesin PilV [Halomonas rituensis]
MKRTQGGWISLEIIGAILVIAAISPMLFGWYMNYQNSLTSQVTASHLSRLTAAVESYTKSNWSTLHSQATSAGAAEIDHATLVAEGYLPADFSMINPLDQDYEVIAIPGPDDSLTILIAGTDGSPGHNGTLTGDDLNLVTRIAPAVVRASGINAGYIPYTQLPGSSPTVFEGPDGAWTFDFSSNAALAGLDIFQGSVASLIHLESGAINNDYLYRSNIGIPELNRMETTLDMHGNDIVDGGTILARDVVIDDVKIDGQPASLSRAVFVMTRMRPNQTISKPECPTYSDGTVSTPLVFVAVDGAPTGGTSGAGMTIATTSGNVTGVVQSVRTDAVDNGSNWTLRMQVYIQGGTAGTTGNWYTVNAASGANWEASLMVGTKCS